MMPDMEISVFKTPVHADNKGFYSVKVSFK